MGRMTYVATAAAASAAVVMLAIPSAVAQPLTDMAVADDGLPSAGVSAVDDVVGDAPADSMPDNPDVELPGQVSAAIGDDATVVSKDYAVTDDGELKDIESGETVTDPALVGTNDVPADPLAKTDGESFVPVSAAEVKEKVAANGGDAAAASDPGSTDGSDAGNADNGGTGVGGVDGDAVGGTGAGGTGENEGNAGDSDAAGSDDVDGSDVAGSDTGADKDAAADAGGNDAADDAASVDASSAVTKGTANGTVRAASLQNNTYGAHWGTYNNTAAFFESDGTMFVQQAKGVIDVSEHNGTIDWQTVKKSGVDGAIIRIGYGVDNQDAQAKRNVSECKRLGIPFGVYWYSYAYDADYAADEADSLSGMLRDLGVSNIDLAYPAYYDLEQWTWTGHKPPTKPSAYDGIVNNWYSRMKKAGYTNLGVYSYTSYLNGPLNSSNIHTKVSWVAQYGPSMQFTGFTSNFRGWQYTSGGSVKGVSGNVDLNAFGSKPYQARYDVRSLPVVTIPDGKYYINSWAKDSFSVDVSGGGTANSVAIQLYGYNNTAAQQFTFIKQTDNSYAIVSAKSGKALDVVDADPHNNAVVRQYDRNGATSQRWFIRDSGSGWYLQSALGNWVLDIAGGVTADGTRVGLYEPNATAAQKFMLSSAVTFPTKNVRISSVLKSNLVMDIAGADTRNGTRVQLYAWNGTKAQMFRFEQVGNGVYRIVSVNSGRVLDVSGGATSNGGVVQQYDSNGTAAQHWAVIDYGGGYAFVSVKAGKAVDVPGASASFSIKLQTYTLNGTRAQQWTVAAQKTARDRLNDLAAAHRKDLVDGTYTFGAANKTAMRLDVSGASKVNGGNVQIWQSNGTKAQRWRITHDGRGYITLTSVNSGRVLDVSGASTANGTNVQQWASNGTWAQKWIAVKDGGSFTLVSALNDSKVLDVSGASTANGANVQLYTDNGTKAQRWVAR